MQDILLQPDDFDFLIKDGDFTIGMSDNQHQALLLMLDKGSLKENPITGVGAFKQLESEDRAAFLREIRRQFTGDGLDIDKIYFDALDNLVAKASYL